MKRTIICTILAALLLLLCAVTPQPVSASAPLSFDQSNVLGDLRSSTVGGEPWDIRQYPFDPALSPRLISFVEYCYSPKLNLQGNFGLYLYIYNPGGLDLDIDAAANTVQLAVKYNTSTPLEESLTEDYEKFELAYCNKSVEPDYFGLFYKFRIVDHESADGKTVLERVNSSGRRYDVSGFELMSVGSQEVEDYTVGGSYFFSGYAKGYGPDSTAENTLTATVKELETIRLDVRPTSYRTNSSATGKDYQNELNSVYFAVDDSVLQRYGRLQKVKAEWYEYLLRPAIITRDRGLYDGFLPQIGTRIESYTESLPFHFGTNFTVTAGLGGNMLAEYDWAFNARPSHNNTIVDIGRASKQVPLLFRAGADSYDVGKQEVADYIYKYNASFHDGTLDIKNRTISQDLFTPTVADGRTRGHNTVNVDAGDKIDLKSYSGDVWDKIGDYGFWATLMGRVPTEGDKSIDPIYELRDADLKGSDGDISARLMVDKAAVSTEDGLKEYVAAAKEQRKTTFLFRFAVTDYYASPLFVSTSLKQPERADAYMAQGSVFLSFDILLLTFNRDGVYTMIPVVSNPIDIINGITPPVEFKTSSRFWFWLIVILIAIVILVGVPLLVVYCPAVFKGIWVILKGIFYVITSPFWIIRAIVKKARGT